MIRKLIVVAFSLLSFSVSAERIKDVASIAGVRTNQLVGYGLVVGLNGTGDNTSQTGFTLQSFRNMLREFGIFLPKGTNISLKNVAAVALSADLPAFAKRGQKIDVTASSIGNAKSLRGGTLLMAPLRGADGRVYAVAQGNLVVNGFGVQGADGSKITVNVPSVGRIPDGATVERPSPSVFGDRQIILNLHHSDFTTAERMAARINRSLGFTAAHAVDAGSVQVRAPKTPDQRVRFISKIENLKFVPGEAEAKIIINSRTGTIVIGKNVKVLPAAVTHGGLTVTISEAPFVSQPNAFGPGDTTRIESSKVEASQEERRAFVFDAGTSLNDLVNAINRVGAAPGDLVAILEALKSVGALKAELEVI